MPPKRKFHGGRQGFQQGQKKKQKQKQPQFEFSGANALPVISRFNRQEKAEQNNHDGCQQMKIDVDTNIDNGSAPPGERVFLAQHFARAIESSDAHSNDLSFPPPPPPPILPDVDFRLADQLSGYPGESLQTTVNSTYKDHDETVTDGLRKESSPESNVQEMMHANGNRPAHRHQQPLQQSIKDRLNTSNDVTPFNTGLPGLMRSHIQVAKPFVFQQAIEGCLHDLGVALPREDNIRLAGVQWIDNVRRALKLPVRTFDTAVVYYHKFRLSHADNEYSFVDAAAAALFAACKIEDTLKKSRDILCAAYNLKIASRADHLSPDDSMFEHSSKTCIGLERLMLEASSFDFRNRHPQHLLVKLLRQYGYHKHSAISKTAFALCLDLYRTFTPLKQSTATMAFACIELAGRLHGQVKKEIAEGQDYKRWSIERSMVMGTVPPQAQAFLYNHIPLESRFPINITIIPRIKTLLDLLDLYTNYQKHTTVGGDFPLDAFLEIQIPLNEEMNTKKIPRYTEYLDPSQLNIQADLAGYAVAATNGVTPRPTGLNGTHNGRLKASPTSPATPITPGTPGIRQKAGERGKEGTVRFMLNPDQERDEKKTIKLYQPLLATMRR